MCVYLSRTLRQPNLYYDYVNSRFNSADENISCGKWVGPICYDAAAIDEYFQPFVDHNVMMSVFALGNAEENETPLGYRSSVKNISEGEMRIRLRKFIFEKAIHTGIHRFFIPAAILCFS